MPYHYYKKSLMWGLSIVAVLTLLMGQGLAAADKVGVEPPALWLLSLVVESGGGVDTRSHHECWTNSIQNWSPIYRPPNGLVVLGEDWRACPTEWWQSPPRLLVAHEKVTPILARQWRQSATATATTKVVLRAHLYPIQWTTREPWNNSIGSCEEWATAWFEAHDHLLHSAAASTTTTTTTTTTKTLGSWSCSLDGPSLMVLHMVDLLRSSLFAYVEALTADGQVYELDLVSTFETFNYQAQWLLQSASADRPPTNEDDARSLWQLGLYGQNQVVGVADTGLDTLHPFLRHGSIAHYSTEFGDAWEEPGLDGHGTHVVSSLLGHQQVAFGDADSAVTDRAYNASGMAPGARVWFADLQTRGTRGLNIPYTLAYMFDQAREQGVFIFSNSWGCSGGPSVCNYYSAHAQSVDRYAAEHPDFLILFAAGNDGEKNDDENGVHHLTQSVNSPGTAKNALTVGASQTSRAGWLQAVPYIPWEQRQAEQRIEREQPAFDCCSLFSTSKWYCCRATLERQISWFADDYQQENVALFSGRGPTSDGRTKPDVVAPGQYIVSAQAHGGTDTVWPDLHEESRGSDSSTLLRSMSGTSMATPLVAGSAVLLRQYFVNGWFDWRQQRHLESPQANQGRSVSSALLKALLIGGARGLSGSVELSPELWPLHNRAQLGPAYPPSVFQGFGAVALSKSLGWSSNSRREQQLALPAERHLYLRDVPSDLGLSNATTHGWCLYDWVVGSTPPRITLVWTDPPASLTSEYALVNDLDLMVAWQKLSDPTIVFRNTTTSNTTNTATTTHWWAGNFGRRRDARNNVEVVELPAVAWTNDAQPALLMILVRGRHIPMGPQGYALVVHGHFGRFVSCRPEPLPAYDHFPDATDADYYPAYHTFETWQVVVIILVATLCLFFVSYLIMNGLVNGWEIVKTLGHREEVSSSPEAAGDHVVVAPPVRRRVEPPVVAPPTSPTAAVERSIELVVPPVVL